MRFATRILCILLIAGAFTTAAAQDVPVEIPSDYVIDRSTVGADIAKHLYNGTATDAPNLDDKRREIRAAGLIPGGDSIGTTGYDFQTNGVMPRRIINWGRNGVQPTGIAATAIAMASEQIFPTTPGRGTHGAVLADFDESRTWLPINLDSWGRLEGSRSGFCDIDYFKGGDFSGQVVASSHANDLSIINLILETEAGSGDYFVLPVPDSDGGLWPRIAIDGNHVIHLIWTYQGLDGTPDGREGVLTYTRTTDQGQSWDPPIDFTGTAEGQLRQVQGGDAYQIAANGSNVAIWYLSRGVQITQLYHNNSGNRTGENLWQVGGVAQINSQRIYSGIDGRNDDSTYYRHESGDSVLFISDTLVAPVGTFDMIVLDDGTVAGVYPEYPVFIQRFTTGGPDAIDTTQTTYTQGFIMQGGLPDFTDRSLRFKRVQQNYGETPQLEELTNSTIPLPEGLDNSATFNSPRGAVAYSRWPQIAISDKDDLFVTFGSAKAGDTREVTLQGSTGDSVVNYYYSHVYATRTTNTGLNWADLHSLTPDGVDAQFPSMAEWVDDEVFMIIQTDDFPGDLVTTEAEPNTTANPPTLGGNKSHPLNKSTFEAISWDASVFAPSSVRDEFDERLGGIDEIAPNPATGETRFSYSVETSSDVALRVVDATGRIIVRLAEGRHSVGEHTVRADLSELAAGAYRLILTIDGNATSAPLNIVR